MKSKLPYNKLSFDERLREAEEPSKFWATVSTIAMIVAIVWLIKFVNSHS